MAGVDQNMPVPTELSLHLRSKMLGIVLSDGQVFRLPFEYLRVFSPSAEVRGHGPGQETLQVGKRDVVIERLEPVGNYAFRPVFSDGHDSGLYSWGYLFKLIVNQETLWAGYLARLEAAGASRDPDAEVPASLKPSPRSPCGKH